MSGSSSLDKIEALLVSAEGNWVPGVVLAKAVGIPLMNLGGFIKPLRTRCPDMVIEGRRGFGYRIAGAASALDQARALAAATPVAAETSQKPGTNYSIHRRLATNMAMLDLVPSSVAEAVKQIAFESQETADACLKRLVGYGVEVHRDLVASGENPLALVAA